MGMFSRKDMIRLFGPLLVEQLLAVLVFHRFQYLPCQEVPYTSN